MNKAQLRKLAFTGMAGITLVMYQNCGQQVGFGDEFAQGRLMADSIVVVDEGSTINDSFDDLSGDNSTDSSGGSTGSTGSNSSTGDMGQGPGQIAITPTNGTDNGAGSQSGDGSVTGEMPRGETPRAPSNMAGPRGSDDGKKDKDCDEDKKDGKGKSGDKKYADKGDKSKDDSSDDSYDDSSALGICITAGSGKSQRIKDDGAEKAETGLATPESLCMSKKACVETMAQAFEVKEFKKTGFCKNDKAHTVRISDAMALGIVDGLLRK